jgi:hypothetical protein
MTFAAIGVGFLFVALDYNHVNANMARWRAHLRKDESGRADAYEDYYAVNRAIGWIGAVFAFLALLVVAVEALAGWPR